MYYNYKLLEQHRIYGFKTKMIEHLFETDRKVKLLTQLLDNFNIPLSRYI